MGALAIDVQHVGSTAVPDLAAKPILDIAVAVDAPGSSRRWSGVWWLSATSTAAMPGATAATCW